MQIRVINPNTTRSMTDKIGAAAQGAAGPGTEIVATQPQSGAVSIEGHFDEAVSALGVADEVLAGERAGADAYVIACFGDPGLLAARELTRAPVIGIAEAAFHVATLISTRFSVITTLGRTVGIAEHLLMQYGFERQCRRVRAAEIPVLDLEDAGDTALARVIAEAHRARDEDDVGALVLGCGGMSDLTGQISREVGLPVVDGVTAAVKLCEALVGIGLGTSKQGELAFPRAKTFTGHFEGYSNVGASDPAS